MKSTIPYLTHDEKQKLIRMGLILYAPPAVSDEQWNRAVTAAQVRNQQEKRQRERRERRSA